MIGSLSFTMASHLSPYACSLRSSISSSFRSWASIRCRIRALNSFGLEVMLVQRSFQPPPRPTLRVVGGHVVLALARHVEARLLQGGDDAGPVLHRRPRVAIRGQPGPGALLKLVEHPVDGLVARLVLRRPGDHARRVLVLERQRVGHRGHVVSDLALAVPLARQVVGRGLSRACPPRDELNQHRPRPARDLVQVRADARDLPGALALGRAHAGMSDGWATGSTATWH